MGFGPTTGEHGSCISVADKVSRQRIHSKDKVVESQHLYHSHYTYVAWVERVDCFKLHANFELVKARSGSGGVL